MNPTVVRYGDTLVKAWIEGVPIEDSVWQQVKNLASVPGVERIAVMPDAHMGNGACVGSAILTRDIVIPAAVGVDIGCGMIAAPLNLSVKDVSSVLHEIRLEIEKRVPVGRTDNGGKNDRGAWHDVPEDVREVYATQLWKKYEGFPDALLTPQAMHQLGTLGTGNHFIELQVELDPPCSWAERYGENATVWLMLHSGSRGVGNRIGTYYTKQARKEMERWHITLPDPELAYLPISSPLGAAYYDHARWAQKYAQESRLLMFQHSLEAIAHVLGTDWNLLFSQAQNSVHIHHNYISSERCFGKPGFVTRKGAINASLDVMGIIPSSMGGTSYITRGLGNTESLNTSSHGAGRTMSRTAIRKIVSHEQFLQEVAGVECRNDVRDAPIDETPSAYKDINQVMEAQKELTQPVVALKALVCVKG